MLFGWVSLCVMLCVVHAAGDNATVCIVRSGSLCPPIGLSRTPIPCADGYLCRGANQSTTICPPGSFCPPGGTELHECPSGSYCPAATARPKECGAFSLCPAGSQRYFNFGTLILAIAPFVLVYWYRHAVAVGSNSSSGGSGSSASGGAVSVAPSDREQVAAAAAVVAAEFTPFTNPTPLQSELSLVQPPPPPPHADVSAPNGAVPLSLKFDRLVSSIRLPDGSYKPIMQSVSATFRAGKIAAVMGPSGAGKTTLFRILLGKLPVSGGAVYVNGAAVDSARRRQLAAITGFVPQLDTMISTLTVEDVLLHAARMRLPASMSDADKQTRVESVMRSLSLTHIRHSVIGDPEAGQRGVSGGERKRVSIGIELVANPSILLLDEPTTGLDSTTSLDVVQLLRDIARTQGVTVVAVLHQPRSSIFALFDDLLLLAPGGRTVYSGPADSANSYFAACGYPTPPSVNTADHIIDVVSGAAGLSAELSRSSQTELKLSGSEVSNTAAAVTLTVAPLTSSADVKIQVIKPPPLQMLATAAAANGESKQLPSANGVDGSATAAEIQAAFVSRWQMMHSPSTPKPAASASAIALPTRSDASWLVQVVLCVRRSLLQRVRSAAALQVVLTELSFHLFAAAVIGIAFLDQNWVVLPLPAAYTPYCPDAFKSICATEAFRDFLPLQLTFTYLAMGLIGAVTGVRTFGSELLVMNRETAAGASLSAYFLGKALSDFPPIAVFSLVYTAGYFTIAAPNAAFGQFFAVMLCLEFVMYACGYCCSVLFKSHDNALLLAVFGSLLAAMGTKSGGITVLSWARWSYEALYIAEVRPDQLSAADRSRYEAYTSVINGYDFSRFEANLAVLILFGVVIRMLALSLLYRRQRALQRDT